MIFALVGRPNVGKSTLFNRLVGGRPALVHDTPGLTRDRRYGEVEYGRFRLDLIDTGGLDPEAEKGVIGAGTSRHARLAVAECDVVVMVIDAVAGLTPLDHEIASELRKSGRPIVVAANKVDSIRREVLAGDAFGLGIEPVIPVSAIHGRGIDDLLDAVLERAPVPPVPTPMPAETDAETEATIGSGQETGPEAAREERPVRIALVGKPNAGKSSILNRLVGTERALVHDEPGTTTDPVDTLLEIGDRTYLLVDTAGIRRRSRHGEDIEKLSVALARRQIERADVVVLVIDAAEGASEQDARLCGDAHEAGRAVVIAVNKSDLVRGATALREIHKKLRDELHFAGFAEAITVSALSGDGMDDLFSAIDRAAAEHRRRISTAELNRFFADVCETHPPPPQKSRAVHIHYLTQARAAPPTFVLWANHPELVSDSYRRFLINQLRARYGLRGTPVRITVRARRGHPKKPQRQGRPPNRPRPRNRRR
ncbi:MAG TPA: ribosome biogenesis GTPase Der [Kofleriaceae bacterium]|nr:ribosome biogenesis GTPase Der [Kofleriaceae bacterium]